jgi:hypothetical protein
VPARISEYQCLGHFAKKCPLIDVHRFTLSFVPSTLSASTEKIQARRSTERRPASGRSRSNKRRPASGRSRSNKRRPLATGLVLDHRLVPQHAFAIEEAPRTCRPKVRRRHVHTHAVGTHNIAAGAAGRGSAAAIALPALADGAGSPIVRAGLRPRCRQHANMVGGTGLAPDIALHTGPVGFDARRRGDVVGDRLVVHGAGHAHTVAAERISRHQTICALFRVVRWLRDLRHHRGHRSFRGRIIMASAVGARRATATTTGR